MSIHDVIRAEVLAWPGVTERPHRFGGIEFLLGGRELGHLHGNRIADLPFTRVIRDQLVAAGRARLHHVLPESGWVMYDIRSEADVPGAISLFRFSYERAVAAQEEYAKRQGDRSPRPADA